MQGGRGGRGERELIIWPSGQNANRMYVCMWGGGDGGGVVGGDEGVKRDGVA